MSPSRSTRRRPKKKKSHKRTIMVIATLLIVVTAIVVVAAMPRGNNGNNGTNTSNNTENSESMQVVLVTNLGNIVIKLRDDMPITTSNFLNLTQLGVYDTTLFHRVVNLPDNLVIVQGGDPATGSTWTGGAIASIPDEFSENPENNKNLRGTVAMANTGEPNSGASQFFINGAYNDHLDNMHPVFGDVIEGMDVVDEMLNVETDQFDKPKDSITLIIAEVQN
jgi:peptidylprolyl isomerase